MLTVKTITVGPSWTMNAYAIICPHTGESALVDPGWDADTLIAALEGSTPVAVLLTHTHPDHVGALAETVQRLNVPLYAHPMLTVVSDRVEGVTRSPLARGVFWNAWEWKPAASEIAQG